MDERVTLLRRVCRSRWFPSMSREELKLYLLLLVSTIRIGREGRISWEILKRTMGASLTRKRTERLAKALRRYGLAHIRRIAPSGRVRDKRREATREVRFLVLRFSVARGRIPGDLKRQGERRDA